MITKWRIKHIIHIDKLYKCFLYVVCIFVYLHFGNKVSDHFFWTKKIIITINLITFSFHNNSLSKVCLPLSNHCYIENISNAMIRSNNKNTDSRESLLVKNKTIDYCFDWFDVNTAVSSELQLATILYHRFENAVIG